METQVYTVTVSKDKTEWLNAKGRLHRTDGPAIEYADGTKCWYQNGERHRTDGPAIECADGTKYWYQNGKLHRTDGPAIEWADGTKYWYINGKQLTESQFLSMTQPKEITMDEIAEKFGIPVSQLKIRKD